MLSPSNPPDKATDEELVVDRVDGDDFALDACDAGVAEWKVLHNLLFCTDDEGSALTSTTPAEAASPLTPT